MYQRILNTKKKKERKSMKVLTLPLDGGNSITCDIAKEQVIGTCDMFK